MSRTFKQVCHDHSSVDFIVGWGKFSPNKSEFYQPLKSKLVHVQLQGFMVTRGEMA